MFCVTFILYPSRPRVNQNEPKHSLFRRGGPVLFWLVVRRGFGNFADKAIGIYVREWR